MAAKTVLEEFVIYLGAEVNQQELDGMINSIAKVSSALQKAAKVAIGFATGIATASTFINKHAVEQDRLAQSVGATVDTLSALTTAGEEIGLTFENSADLVEEMMNKFGEMKSTGEFSAVEESMAALNLQWENMKRLSPEEQFIKIMDTATKAKDAQTAAFAVDSLLGGEANKVLGSLRRRGTTLSEIIKQTKKLNYETERSRKGAERHVDAMSKFEKVVTSISKLFSGIFGEALADITEEMNEWFELNKEIIQQNIVEFAERLSDAFRALWRVGRSFIEVIISITKALGGLANIFKLLKFAAVAAGIATVVFAFLKWKTVLYAIIAVFKVLTAVMLANPFVLLTAAILAALVAAEDFYKWINGNTDGTMFGKWLGSADEFFKSVTDGFNELINAIGNFVTDTIAGAIQWGLEFAAAIKEGLTLALADIAQFGVDGLAQIMAWADSVYTYVVDKFANMIPDFKGMLPDAVVGFFGGDDGTPSSQSSTDGNQYSNTKSTANSNIDNSKTEYHITATGIADAPTLAASIQDMNTKKANNVAAMQ